MIIAGILLLVAVPLGFWIAWMGRDELLKGRVWFRSITFISVALSGFFYFNARYLTYTFTFVAFFALIAFIMSFHENWTKTGD
jgi:hypothetical protein